MRPPLRVAATCAALVVLAACGSDARDSGGTGSPEGAAGGGGGSAGSAGTTGALGGSDETVLLAEATAPLPEAPLAWTAYDVPRLKHGHGPSFVHARADTTLTVADDRKTLMEGQAAFVPGGAPHEHGDGLAWDVVLAAPGAAPPPGVTAPPVFASKPLEGLPNGSAKLSALLVTLPPGAQTSVHTHPGPEFIYVTRGRFDYQNAIVGQVKTGEGDGHTLRTDTAVQKRNPSGGPAAFLSWFIVDPDKPFAPPASFG